MDGTVVSAMRTGAVTAVALRHLADPATEVARLLGAGVLAHTQPAALRVVPPCLSEVRVFDPDTERLARFCARADGRPVELADVVARAHPGRTAAGERIVVTPVGLAMDDVVAARHVLAGARGRGLGTPLGLRSGPPGVGVMRPLVPFAPVPKLP